MYNSQETVPAASAAVSPPPVKLSDVFRKKFHVPTAWRNHAEFQKLIEHKYPAGSISDTINFVRQCLSETGYRFGPGDDMQRIEHDYVCFILQDILCARGTPFITEQNLKDDAAVMAGVVKVFNGTPDFIIHGKKVAEKQPFYVVDVYSGTKPDAKKKYMSSLISKHIPHVQVLPITHNGLVIGLEQLAGGILSKKEIDYISNHYAVFQTEAQYWRSCLRMGTILFNDKKNCEEVVFSPAAVLSEKLIQFNLKVREAAGLLLTLSESAEEEDEEYVDIFPESSSQ